MAEVIALGPTLSDSTFKTRPHFKAYIQTDANAGLDVVQAFEAQRQARQMKFPSLVGNKTPTSLQHPSSLEDPGYKKWNDEGDHRSTAPSRFYSNLVDPVSGFMSAGGEVMRGTGKSKVKYSPTQNKNNTFCGLVAIGHPRVVGTHCFMFGFLSSFSIFNF